MKLFSRDFFRFSSPAAREWRGISAFDLVAVESPAPSFPLSKAGLCLLVVFLWLAVGVFGRDPWKPDELLLSGFLARPGALSVAPSLWGEFAIGAGPLSIWMAAAAARFLPFAPLESALFAQAVLLATGFLGIGIAGARRLDLRAGFLAVLLCAGAVGFLARGHWLSGGAAGFAGMAWLLAGLAILPRASLAGGATTGSALGFLFLAAGPFECAAGAAAIVVAYCKRPKSPARVWPGAAATAVFALPWLVIWPALAAAQNPEWFARWMEWQAEQARGLESPAALAANVGEYVKLVAWAAFPLWILATAAGFAKLRPTADAAAAATGWAAWAAWIAISAAWIARGGGEIELFAGLPALALLAAGCRLPKSGAAALDWFALLVVGILFIGGQWLLFAAKGWGAPAPLARWVEEWTAGVWIAPSFWAVAAAATAVFLWVLAISKFAHSSERALFNWSASLVVTWIVFWLLWMPTVNAVKTYGGVAAAFARALPAGACVSATALPLSRAAQFSYFGIEIRRDDSCAFEATLATDANAAIDADEITRAARPGDDDEIYILRRRTSGDSN